MSNGGWNTVLGFKKKIYFFYLVTIMLSLPQLYWFQFGINIYWWDRILVDKFPRLKMKNVSSYLCGHLARTSKLLPKTSQAAAASSSSWIDSRGYRAFLKTLFVFLRYYPIQQACHNQEQDLRKCAYKQTLGLTLNDSKKWENNV